MNHGKPERKKIIRMPGPPDYFSLKLLISGTSQELTRKQPSDFKSEIESSRF